MAGRPPGMVFGHDLTRHVAGAPYARTCRGATHHDTNHQFDPDSIPSEALMPFRFVRTGSMARSIAGRFQPVIGEIVTRQRQTSGEKQVRVRSGERS